MQNIFAKIINNFRSKPQPTDDEQCSSYRDFEFLEVMYGQEYSLRNLTTNEYLKVIYCIFFNEESKLSQIHDSTTIKLYKLTLDLIKRQTNRIEGLK